MPVLIAVKAAHYVLSAALAGVVGNRSDSIVVGLLRELRDRWERLDPGDQLKIEHAARRAYLLATISACSAYLKSADTPPAWTNQGVMSPRREGDPQTRAVERLMRTATRELRRPGTADDVPGTDRADWRIGERGSEAGSRAAEFRHQLVSDVIDGLRRQDSDLPDGLFARMRDGWQTGDGTTVSWYGLMTAFFQKEMDRDASLARLITQDLLQGLEARFDEMSGVVERIDNNLQDVLQNQKAVTAQVPDQLADLTAQIIGLGGTSEVIAAGIGWLTSQGALQQASLASEVAQADEELFEELRSRPFAGRHAELERLDDFVSKAPGRLVVTAPAGYGKTALLAEWRDELLQQGFFVAAHFIFSDAPETREPRKALRHLARQLYVYYGVNESVPSDEPDLRDVISTLLTKESTREGEPLVARAGQPLVVIIDALDEAKDIINPLPRNPHQLKQGVCEVVSARAEHPEQHEYLKGWSQDAESLSLSPLSPQEVRQWIRAEGQGRLARWADDPAFVAAVAEKTQGFPLYLHHLVTELVRCADQGQDPSSAVKQTPDAFAEYVRSAVTQLGQDIHDPDRLAERLLGLLVAAKGPLDQVDIGQLLPDASPLRLSGLPWQATRWMKIRRGPRGSEYSFSHVLLAQEFEEPLGAGAAEARQALLQYCRDWRRHHSPYALQYAVDHFLEAASDGDNIALETLFTLASDNAYSSAQIQHLPNHPELPLKNATIAFQAATAADDPARMTEFLLVHAWQLETIRRGSPLAAVTDDDVERAWRLADLMDIEPGEIWQLLIAWWLKDHDHEPLARATLARLQDNPRPIRLTPLDKCTAWLLAQLADLDTSSFGELRRTLIGTWTWDVLIRGLAARGLIVQARQVLDDWTPSDGEPWTRDSLLEEFLRGWIDREDPAQLPAVLAELIDEAGAREDPNSLAQTLITIADVLIDCGLLEQATGPIERAENIAPGSATKALEALAGAQQRKKLYDEMLATEALTSDICTQLRIRGATVLGFLEQGDSARAQTVWRSAPRPCLEDAPAERAMAFAIRARVTWRLSQGGTDAPGPVPALAAIPALASADDQISVISDAVLQASATEPGAADLKEALEIARTIAPVGDRIRAVTDCLLQVRAFEAAALVARLAPEDHRWPTPTELVENERSRPQAQRALRLARAGQAEEARRVALQGTNRYLKASVLRQIAQVEIQDGAVNQAIETAGLIEGPLDQVQVLVALALTARDSGSRSQVLERAVAVATGPGPVPSVSLLKIAQAYALLGDSEAARRLIAIMLSPPERGVNDGKDELGRALDLTGMLVEIAVQRASALDHATAVEILKRAQRLIIELAGNLEADPGLTARLADALAYAGEIKDALSVAKKISDPPQATRALWNVARHQINQGDSDGAKTTLLLARRRALKIPRKGQDTHDFGFFNFLNFDFFRSREDALSQIARLQADAGAYEEAAKTVMKEGAETQAKIAGYVAAAQGAREPRVGHPSAWIRAAQAASGPAIIHGSAALTTAAEPAVVARAARAASELPAEDTRNPDQALADKALAEARLGDFPAAMRMAAKLPDSLAGKPLAVIARGQAKAGDDTAARLTADLALSKARSSAADTGQIARELALAGMSSEAIAATRLALEQHKFSDVRIALRAFEESGDRNSIKQAAALLGAYPQFAKDGVAMLARCYPEATKRIVATIEHMARRQDNSALAV